MNSWNSDDLGIEYSPDSEVGNAVLKGLAWTLCAVFCGCAWYGVLKLANMGLRALGVSLEVLP